MNQPENHIPNKKVTARSLLGFLIRSVIAGLALAFVIVYLWPGVSERFSRQAETPVNLPAIPVAPVSYADAVDRAAPSVVSICLLYTSDAADEYQRV